MLVINVACKQAVYGTNKAERKIKIGERGGHFTISQFLLGPPSHSQTHPAGVCSRLVVFFTLKGVQRVFGLA